MTTTMKSFKLRSTTALAMTFSLAASAGWAQQIMPSCNIEAPMVPCVADDQVIETEDQFREAQDGGLFSEGIGEGTGEFYLVSEGFLGVAYDIEVVNPALEAELSPELKAEYDAAVAASTDPNATVAGELLNIEDIEVMADEEPAGEVLDSEPDVPETDGTAEAEMETTTEADTGVAADGQTDADVAAEQDAEVTAEQEATVQEGTDPAATDDQALADALEAELAENQSGEEAEVAVNGETAAEGENASTGEIEFEEPPAEGEAMIDSDVTADAAAEGNETEEMPEEVAPTPEETVEEAPITAAASAETEGEGEAEVTTEEVTEDDVRSADEDFDTDVNGDVSAEASANTNNDDDDDGLSSFERAILLGLGAVAIGSILDNGDEVVSNSGDRIVVETESGQLRVLKNDDVLLRQPGSQVQTEQFSDGSTRTTVTREDGSQVITIRANDGRVLRRALVQTDGTQVELFDDTQVEQEVDVATLPKQTAPTASVTATATEEELRQALAADIGVQLDRTFSLRQVRNIKEVRELAPVIELDTITFKTASAAIQPDQARELALLGTAIRDYIDRRPEAVFLVEGHTDAVGDAGYNLALSDRRAETVALALTEYFDVPPANLITQGYGEAHLKVRTPQAEQANRRAVVRNITQLLR